MVSVRKPLTPATLATESMVTTCVVQDIDMTNMCASVRDRLGNNRLVTLRALPGKGVDYPATGETWLISREYGDWMFVASIGVVPSGGPQGPQGPQGAQGSVGPQGTQGPQGPIDTPTGTIIMYGGSSAPTGWLLCDGSAVSRTTYASLYGVIGTAYGAGDGSTTFNLPDFTNKFARGNATDTGGGSDTHTHTSAAHSHTLGAGEALITLQEGTTKIIESYKASTSWSGNLLGTSAAASSFTASSGVTTATALGGSTDSTTPGDTGSSSNVPAYTDVNFIVKT